MYLLYGRKVAFGIELYYSESFVAAVFELALSGKSKRNIVALVKPVPLIKVIHLGTKIYRFAERSQNRMKYRVFELGRVCVFSRYVLF